MAVLMARMLGKPIYPLILSDVAEGETICLNETVDGVTTPVAYYVGKHNYEADLGNVNRTLLIRADTVETTKWGTANTDTWPNSIVYSLMNNSESGYITRFSEKIKTAIATTTYEYTEAKGGTSVVSMASPLFALSVAELGIASTYANPEGEVLDAAGAVGVTDGNYWSRSSYNTSGSYAALYISKAGTSATRLAYSGTQRTRPCLSLPGNIVLDPFTLLPKEEFL